MKRILFAVLTLTATLANAASHTTVPVLVSGQLDWIGVTVQLPKAKHAPLTATVNVTAIQVDERFEMLISPAGTYTVTTCYTFNAAGVPSSVTNTFTGSGGYILKKTKIFAPDLLVSLTPSDVTGCGKFPLVISEASKTQVRVSGSSDYAFGATAKMYVSVTYTYPDNADYGATDDLDVCP